MSSLCQPGCESSLPKHKKEAHPSPSFSGPRQCRTPSFHTSAVCSKRRGLGGITRHFRTECLDAGGSLPKLLLSHGEPSSSFILRGCTCWSRQSEFSTSRESPFQKGFLPTLLASCTRNHSVAGTGADDSSSHSSLKQRILISVALCSPGVWKSRLQ